jgi:hypothetical protein
LHSLLTESNRLHLVAFFGNYHMAFGGMTRGALRLIEAAHTSALKAWVFFHFL